MGVAPAAARSILQIAIRERIWDLFIPRQSFKVAVMIGTHIVPQATLEIPQFALRPPVVLALSGKECKLFFDSLPGRLAGSPLIWKDTLSANLKWPDLLNEIRPGILVTGWSTPRIPLPWALSPDSPLR